MPFLRYEPSKLAKFLYFISSCCLLAKIVIKLKTYINRIALKYGTSENIMDASWYLNTIKQQSLSYT